MQFKEVLAINPPPQGKANRKKESISWKTWKQIVFFVSIININNVYMQYEDNKNNVVLEGVYRRVVCDEISFIRQSRV